MNQEQISAFLDDETAAEDIDGILAALDSAEGRATFRRMCQVRATLAGCTPKLREVDLSQAVAAAVRTEPLSPVANPRVVPLAPRQRRVNRPLAGLALAASVALAAVIVPQLGERATTDSPLEVAAAPANAPDAGSGSTMQSMTETAAAATTVRAAPALSPTLPVTLASTRARNPADGASRELVIAAPQRAPGGQAVPKSATGSPQLSSLLINHARFGGGYAMSGPLSYARVAAYREDAIEKGKR